MGAIVAVVVSAISFGHNLAGYDKSLGHRVWTWIWAVVLIVSLWLVFWGVFR